MDFKKTQERNWAHSDVVIFDPQKLVLKLEPGTKDLQSATLEASLFLLIQRRSSRKVTAYRHMGHSKNLVYVSIGGVQGSGSGAG